MLAAAGWRRSRAYGGRSDAPDAPYYPGPGGHSSGVGQIGDTAYLIGGEAPGRLSSIIVVTPG